MFVISLGNQRPDGFFFLPSHCLTAGAVVKVFALLAFGAPYLFLVAP